MENTKAIITLTEDLFIGKGAHKSCYLHPYDNTLCIKTLHHTPDVDLDKELFYRKTRNIRHLQSNLLPQYLGVIETNLGKGYVFERICDYNGNTSISIKDYITTNRSNDDFKKNIVSIILDFKAMYFQEKIVTSDMDPQNFLIQYISPDKYTFKIIDNIGTPVLIPLAYYLDSVATRRTMKYWDRFLIKLKRLFPDSFTEEILEQIK